MAGAVSPSSLPAKPFQGTGNIARNSTVVGSKYTGFGAAAPTMTHMPSTSNEAVPDNPPGA